ncbi:unnamed protein product [Moneuplotes crassus]|uniref:Signal recognition particle subunit SRP72 n=1 Tax=Euplotes crassus TaxID=5936 RepID=A0AAD1X4J6_EUPCR|nr:unnamed protein product [Moneuplotes crassus]
MEEADKSRIEILNKISVAIGEDDSQKILEAVKELKDLSDSDDALCRDITRVARIREGDSQHVLNELQADKAAHPFLYVYCLHTLGKQQEAHDEFEALGINRNEYYSGLLFSQILYKLDQKEKASEVLEEIINSGNEHLENDLTEILTNMLASYTSETDAEKIKKLEEKLSGEVNADYLFNTATAFASIKGQEKVAAKKLKESYEIAKENNEEGNDKYQVLSSYLAAKIISQTVNYAEFEWNDFKLDDREADSFKLPENKAAYIINLAIIKKKLGFANSTSGLHGLISSVSNSQDINQHQKDAFKANLEALSQTKLDYESILKEYEDKPIIVALLKAQIQITKGHFRDAIKDLIKYCQDNNETNGRLLGFLLKATIDNKFTEEKNTIIEFTSNNSSELPTEFLVIIAQILIETQEFFTALKILEKVKDSTDDMNIKAGYLSALAESDTKAAFEYLESLNIPTPELEDNEDLHELLQEPLSTDIRDKKRKKKEDTKVQETKKGGSIFIPKAKKNKKVKYPKNFDPENPGPMPDPERWIPKWQRSKGKKKLRMRGPQGNANDIGQVAKKGATSANIKVSTK